MTLVRLPQTASGMLESGDQTKVASAQLPAITRVYSQPRVSPQPHPARHGALETVWVWSAQYWALIGPDRSRDLDTDP